MRLELYLCRHQLSHYLREELKDEPVSAEAKEIWKKNQEVAFGLIAGTLTKNETVLLSIYEKNPTLRPTFSSNSSPNGTKLWIAMKEYVLQNTAIGLYDQYDLKLRNLRLEMCTDVADLIDQMNNLYVLLTDHCPTNDRAKISKLGIALGSEWADFMRNNAYQKDVTYFGLCENIRSIYESEKLVKEASAKKATEVTTKAEKTDEETASSESANSADEYDPRERVKRRYHPRQEFKRRHSDWNRGHSGHRSRSRSQNRFHKHYRGGHSRDRDRRNYRSRSSSRESSRNRSFSPSYRSRGDRKPGRDKRNVHWSTANKQYKDQRRKTDIDHYVNAVVQASKRDHMQCKDCHGWGHRAGDDDCPERDE